MIQEKRKSYCIFHNNNNKIVYLLYTALLNTEKVSNDKDL